MANRTGDMLEVEKLDETEAVQRWREKHAAPSAPAPTPATSPPAAGTAQSRIQPVTPTITVARGPAGRLAAASVCVLLVGAWGALVPFLGPALRFSADGAPSWFWNFEHALLWFAPGAAAFLAGAAVLGVLPMTRRGRGRIGTGCAGVVMVLAGAWFVLGPLAWPVIQRSAGVFVPAGPLRELDYQLVYSLGPGILLLALGGMVIGWGLRGRQSRRTAAPDDVAPRVA